MCSFDNSITNYEFGQFLGRGGFATVYKAIHTATEMEVAIKMIDKRTMRERNMLDKVRNEVKIHSKLKHPSILKCYNCFEDDNYVYMILEYCHYGELGQYLENINKSTLSESEAFSIINQVLKGILFLHKHGILHRDLTLSNLLVTEKMEVKIADFGLATKFLQETHKTVCGTPNYMSPEVALKGPQGTGVDIWGFGVVFYTLLYGRPPFETTTAPDTLERVVREDVKFPWDISWEGRDLIMRCLEKDAMRRISVEDVRDHPFFVKHCSSFESGFYSNSGFSRSSYCDRSINKMHISGGVSLQEYPPRTFESNSGIQIDMNRKLHHVSGFSQLLSNGRQEFNKNNCSSLSRLNSSSSQHRSQSSIAKENTSGSKKPQPLSSLRVPPREMTVKGARYKVLRTGHVVFEHLSCEQIVSSFEVSSNGMEIVAKSFASRSKDRPPDLIRTTYEEMPRHLWPKYQRLYNYVLQLKTATFKVTLVTDEAMCHLMEVTDHFVVKFNSGIVMKKNSENVTITLPNRTSPIMCSFDTLQECCDVDASVLLHFSTSYYRCLNLEQTLSSLPSSDSLFPAVFGSKRSEKTSTANRIPERAQSTPLKPSHISYR